jgi:uncharacterized protein (DUF2249 family)
VTGHAATDAISVSDRVSSVLARDDSLIEVFAAVSPAFERLRNPAMRRVMSKLVTVAQAARIGGVDAELLLSRLNAHIGRATSEPACGDTMHEAMEAAGRERPPALAAIAADAVVMLDVRDELRNGREPFSRIMAARRSMPADGALCVRAIFEPVPLYAVMARQGLSHWTEQLAADDWQVWFYPEQSVSAAAIVAPATVAQSGTTEGAGADVVVLDVRGLEPPEPMERTLAALETLAPGATLVQLNVRVPRFLLPLLAERGFTYEVREQEPDLVRLFIRRSHTVDT